MRHHLCRRGVALADIRQLRSQGQESVHAQCAEKVTRSDGREGANEVGCEIGVRGGIGDRNGVEGGNGDVNGNRDGDGAGTRTGWRRMNERKMETGAGPGTW